MTTFLLIRHGETDAVGRVLAGRSGHWPLNARGEQQVRRLARRLAQLPICRVLSSPLERALATAQAVAAEHRLAPEVVDDFDEIAFGDWEGKAMDALQERDDWQQYNACRTQYPPPGGEPIQNVQARMTGRIECLRQIHNGGLLALVSHGDPLRAAVAYYLGIPLDHLSRFEISPASVTTLDIGDWGARLVCLNESNGVCPGS